MVELTQGAREALETSFAAARRFDPDAHLRVVREGGVLRAIFAAGPEPGDQMVDLGEVSVGFQAGITGTVDAGEHNELSMVGP